MANEEQPITKPYQLRNLGNLTRAYGYNPAEITKHRRVIIDSTPEETERVNKIVSVEKIESSRDFEHLEKTFPNYRKAVWIYERAPKDKHIEIFFAQKIYRAHTELRYTVEDIFRRNINFGITGKEGKVQPLLTSLIQNQLARLENWSTKNP